MSLRGPQRRQADDGVAGARQRLGNGAVLRVQILRSCHNVTYALDDFQTAIDGGRVRGRAILIP